MKHKTEKFEFTLLQRELLGAIRGKTSQAHLSKKLGFRSNKIHRWESGGAAVPWEQFCLLCQRQRIPLRGTCERVLGYTAGPEMGPKFIRHLFGKESHAQLAMRLGVSRSLVSRWNAGRVEPSLEQVLKLIHLSFWSLPEFLGGLVPSGALPSLQGELERERKAKELLREYPWISALLLYAGTEEYRQLGCHQEGFFARKIGVSLELERKAITVLSQLGIVTIRAGLVVPLVQSINSSNDPESDRKIREYWASRCFSTIRSNLPDLKANSWGYMILTTSPENVEKIRELYFAFFQDVRNLISDESEKCAKVHLLSAQFLDIEVMK